MAQKLTIEEMQNIARKKGGKCLSKEYFNTNTKLKWQCGKGHIWDAVPSSIKNGRWCAECAQKKKLTLDEMYKLADKNGGRCLSNEYINVKIKLKWLCKKGHIWEATPDNIKRGRWCPECANSIVAKKLSLDIDEMHKLAKQKGGRCLSKEYVNAKTKLEWQCNEGHKWKTVPSIIKSGAWCPECAKSRVAKSKIKFSISDMLVLAEERGGKCLSNEYKSIVVKLKWQCSEGHIWEATPDNVKRGRWCPECSDGSGERICRVFFETIFQRQFPKSRLNWLVNKEGNQLEFDGYSKSLKLAFEHQGKQHFKYHERFHHKKEDFYKAINNDEDKVQLCREHGITLICVPEIPGLLPIYRIKEFIKKECVKAGIEIPANIEKVDIDLKKIYTSDSKRQLSYIKKLARDKGGICLSDIFIGFSRSFTFKCKIGHTFRLKPQLLINGFWCPFCHSQEAALRKMKLIAESRGGKCLSTEYVNAKAKLGWQCSEGHTWMAIPSNIKRGRWCPVCARLKLRLTIEEIHRLAKKRGGMCLSTEYINANIKIKWQCKEGHVWEANANTIKRGGWCHRCSLKIFTIEEMHKLADKRNGKCLSTEYINANTKLKWRCSEGHIWDATPSKIKQGRWCPECATIFRADKLKLGLPEMYKLAERRGGKCLSVIYVNNQTKLNWQCSKGHTWEAIPSSIRRGSWCPACAKSKKYPKNQLILI